MIGWGTRTLAMKRTRLFSVLPAAVFVAVLTCAAHAASTYIDPSQVDLVHVLAPPPARDTDEGKADLAAVHAAQASRTEADVKSAQADARETVFRFADVMGPEFKPENLPFATTFFDNVHGDDEEALALAKSHFNRPRPFVADPDIKPVVAQPANASYPSGHSTFAYVNAILLADMVPEKATAIFKRAAVFARNRVIAGVHYPTDIEAGRIAGATIDNVLLHEPRFMVDFAKARGEVRHALGLPD
jgi:acid phosphatase (class A)